MAVRYDAVTAPGTGPKPGLEAIAQHWHDTTGLGDLGIYNPRKARGLETWSVHADGRAVDLAADAHDPMQLDLADRYVAFLIAVAERIQAQYLIWNRRSYKPGRGWQPYGGTSPHTDHIHVELNRDGADYVTVGLLDRLWTAHTHPAEVLTEEDLMALTIDGRQLVIDTYSGANRGQPDAEGLAYWAGMLATCDTPDQTKGVLNALRDQLGLSVL